MPDFERRVTVKAVPDKAFQYLADPGNLPRYVSSMVLARPQGGEQLHVAADVQGRHEEGDARFRTDATQRRIEWGAERGSGYGGSLQVSSSSAGSTVIIRLHLAHDEDEAEVNRVLDETAGNIVRLLS